MVSEPQAGGKDLKTGGVEGAPETAEVREWHPKGSFH